jgi:hypothetical protein
MKCIKLYILLLLIIASSLNAQDSLNTSKVKLTPYYSGWGAHIEYSYMKANSVGAGANYLIQPTHLFFLKKQITFSSELTLTSVFYKNNFILGQRFDIGVNLDGLSPDAHFFFENNDNSDFRVGGKIGLSFGNFMYLHYRYALPINSYENSHISKHGVTLTIIYNFVAFDFN